MHVYVNSPCAYVKFDFLLFEKKKVLWKVKRIKVTQHLDRPNVPSPVCLKKSQMPHSPRTGALFSHLAGPFALRTHFPLHYHAKCPLKVSLKSLSHFLLYFFIRQIPILCKRCVNAVMEISKNQTRTSVSRNKQYLEVERSLSEEEPGTMSREERQVRAQEGGLSRAQPDRQGFSVC